MAASTPADQAAAREVLRDSGRHGFVQAWMRRFDLHRAADDAAEAGRAAAQLMVFDADTEAAVDAATRSAADAMRDRIIETLVELHPEAAQYLVGGVAASGRVPEAERRDAPATGGRP